MRSRDTNVTGKLLGSESVSCFERTHNYLAILDAGDFRLFAIPTVIRRTRTFATRGDLHPETERRAMSWLGICRCVGWTPFA